MLPGLQFSDCIPHGLDRRPRKVAQIDHIGTMLRALLNTLISLRNDDEPCSEASHGDYTSIEFLERYHLSGFRESSCSILCSYRRALLSLPPEVNLVRAACRENIAA